MAVARLPRHMTYRVYCRYQGPAGPCAGSPWPRLVIQKARKLAERHADDTGHPVEVVRLIFQTILQIGPRAAGRRLELVKERDENARSHPPSAS